MVLSKCGAQNDPVFQFGFFAETFTNDVASASFNEKYFYCLWWVLRNMCSYGQSLMTSMLSTENLFSISICIGGLISFSHLIDNMQTYLQSLMLRLEEWQVKQRETEEWMWHRQLPPELQEHIRRFVQYKWLATCGVDEETILKSLPLDLRQQIQWHLCLALIRRVPFLVQMDTRLLDAICERLVSSLHTKDAYLMLEGDSFSAGDFCGQELLTWELVPTVSLNLPSSTRTVRTLTEVEAFALRAEDMKFMATQFKRMHIKKLQHAFWYYYHQWQTWGACYIQVAWRCLKKRKIELAMQEFFYLRLPRVF